MFIIFIADFFEKMAKKTSLTCWIFAKNCILEFSTTLFQFFTFWVPAKKCNFAPHNN